MLRKSLVAIMAGSALVLTAPAFARPANDGSGGIWAKGREKKRSAKARQRAAQADEARANSEGPDNASATGVANADDNSVLATGTGSQATVNSQGLQNASPTGVANASDSSVLASGALAATATQLAGLNTGLTVRTSTGATLGTVTQIIGGPNNTVRAVVVTSADGQTYTLAPTSLTVSGGIVTTTQTSFGG